MRSTLVTLTALSLSLLMLNGCDRDCCCCAPESGSAPIDAKQVNAELKAAGARSEVKATPEELRELKAEMERIKKETKPLTTGNTITSAVEKSPATAPTVTGSWVGRWESGKPGHGGSLKCEAKEAAPYKWEAVFTADYGLTMSYNVTLEGKRGEGKVLFGGEVNLGYLGGVFKWSGDANSTEFNGKFEGGGETGSFKMKRPGKQ